MIHSGVGRFEGVASLIHPGIDLQAVATPRGRHELPHPYCARATDRRVGQTTFDERQVHEVFGETPRAQLLADHSFIAAEAGQPDFEAITGVELEEFEILEYSAVARELRDVDVERRVGVGPEQILCLLPDVFAAHRHVRARGGEGVGGARVQAVQRRLIGRRILLRPGQCCAELYRRAVTRGSLRRYGGGQWWSGRSNNGVPGAAGDRGCAHHREPKDGPAFHRVAK